MAKKITRTVKTTEAEILYVNAETGSTKFESVTLAGTYKNGAQIIKKAPVDAETGFIPVSVKSTHVKETLMWATEEDFISIAHPVVKGDK